MDPVEESLFAHLRQQDQDEAMAEAMDSRAWQEGLNAAKRQDINLEVCEGDELEWIDTVTARVPCWLYVKVDPLDGRERDDEMRTPENMDPVERMAEMALIRAVESMLADTNGSKESK